jgi:chromosome segregation ATPase
MSDVQKAAHDFRALAAKFRIFLEVADTLERIGSLEEAERSAIKRKDSAVALETEAKASLAKVHHDLDNRKQGVKEAKEQAEVIISDAHIKAEAIRSGAKLDASVTIDAVGHEKSKVEEQVNNLRSELTRVQSQLDLKRKELEAITKQINNTRERIAALAG